jgi:hypothetical protein
MANKMKFLKSKKIVQNKKNNKINNKRMLVNLDQRIIRPNLMLQNLKIIIIPTIKLQVRFLKPKSKRKIILYIIYNKKGWVILLEYIQRIK